MSISAIQKVNLRSYLQEFQKSSTKEASTRGNNREISLAYDPECCIVLSRLARCWKSECGAASKRFQQYVFGMAVLAVGAHLKLALVSFVPRLIMFCCSGPILSFLISCFLDAQSSNNLSFNCHIKRRTAVLPFGIVLEYYFWSPVRGFDLPLSCLESMDCHQSLCWAFSLYILFHPCTLSLKVATFPKVNRASPLTDRATGQYVQLHTA